MFHPILRSTFCPVPSFMGNLDHFALCVLDASPGEMRRLNRRKLSRLSSEERVLIVKAGMLVTHPAVAPGIHAHLTVLEGRRNMQLLLNFYHFQYGELQQPGRVPGGELTPFS